MNLLYKVCMKAFWWFDQNKIAGMARPGFNHCRWFDMPYDEAIVMGWLGQFSSGSIPLQSFRQHVATYAPKVASFYRLNDEQKKRYFAGFNCLESFKVTLTSLANRSRFVEYVEVSDDQLHFEIHKDQLDNEINFLKSQEIEIIISLTENHHAKDYLQEHFDLHHISIQDMGAPTLDQAHKLKCLLELAAQKNEKLVVHCLAGIGRTSTILIAAELLRGKKLPELLSQLSKQNPSYAFVGSQAEFIKTLESSLV